MRGAMDSDTAQTDRLCVKADTALTAHADTSFDRSVAELLHELQVHRIELEMQNEKLRQIQLELEKSRDRYRDFYDFAPVGYLALNDQGQITELNHTAALLFGVERKALLMRRLSGHVAPEDRVGWNRYFQQMLTDPDASGCELMFMRSDGGIFFAHLAARRIMSDRGEPGLYITLTDTTQQQQAEAKNVQIRQMLDAERLMFHAILDNAPIGIWMLGSDGKIKFINETFCRSLGVSEQQLLKAKHYSELMPQLAANSCMESDQACFAQQTPYRSSEWLPFADGTEHLFEVTKVKLRDGDGRATGLIGLANDITERHHAEKSRAEFEEKLRVIFECTLDGIVLADENGMIVDCNPEFVRQSGMTHDQLKHIHLWELRPGDKAESARNMFFQAVTAGSGDAAEFKYRKPDGEVICIEARGRTIQIGGKTYLQCITHDTTSRHHAQRLLRESEEKLRIIYEGALDGIVLVNAQTRRFVNGNPEFCRMLGLSQQEFIDFGIADIHPPEDLHWIVEDFEKHISGAARLSVDIPVMRRDGSVFYADIKSSPVELGGKKHIVGIFRDITERREAERLCLMNAQKYQMLFESSRDALMTLAPPQWKYASANEATLTLFGVRSVAEFTALEPADLSPHYQIDGSLSADKMREMIATAMQSGSHFFEWEHLRLDGRPFIASVLLTRVSLGDVLFIQATVRDITEQKLRVLELKEYQALLRELAAQGSASREAELKHIAREVHDELGQLLTALRMDISLVRIRFGEQDPLLMEKVQDMLALVDKAIKGVRNVTSNLRPPVLDIGIAAAILWLGDQFNARTATNCTVHILNDPKGMDDASTLTLFRIVQESLTNVARHAAASCVEIRVGQSGDDICVEIEDDGKGFDPVTMSAKVSFGLMGMKERAMAVGGSVEISSSPSQGTIVSVYIPLAGRNTDD